MRAAAVLLLMPVACYVHHGASVRPGFQTDLGVGRVTPEYRAGFDDEGAGVDAQLSFRYGWRFGQNVALLGSLSAPLAYFDANDGRSYALPIPFPDLYLQVLGTGLDAGVGWFLPLQPYVQAGRRFPLQGGDEVEVSGGAMLGDSSWRPFAVATLSRGVWRFGAWFDARRYGERPFDTDGCGECTEQDVASAIYATGIVVGLSPGGSAPRRSAATAERPPRPPSRPSFDPGVKGRCLLDGDCAQGEGCTRGRCTCSSEAQCPATHGCFGGICTPL